ncbi:MAG: DNA primase [Elusimicrobiaceae bacterium]|nr:DNA primase [Elusimicrobiaceae bacterium]
MKQNIVEQIRDSVDILDLVKDYVPAIRRSGTSYKACCPFHQEKTPSFTVSPDKGLYYCFGCQTGGDIFDFLMKIENLSFNEAVRKLAERAGIDWHQEDLMTEEEKARLKLYKLMDFAKEFYHKQLFSERGASARNYIKSRALTKETVEKFALGLSFFDGLTAAALKAGFTIDDLKKTGLVNSNRNDLFKNRLMFPILNHRGETVALGGRVLGEGMPKYLNSPDTPLFSKSRVLYALNFAAPCIRKEGRAVLLEGYMDVIAAHQAGVANCVAPLGTSFNENHAKLLKRYTDTVTVLFDPDEAGQKASKRTALILLEQGFYVTVANLPEGLDPDEYIIKYGADSFKKITQTGKDIVTYQLDKFLNGAVAISAKEKSEFAAEIVDIISRQQDKIIKAEWTSLAANRLGIEQSILLENLKNKPKEKVYKTEPAPVQNKKENLFQGFLPAEISLVRIILKYPAYVGLCDELQNTPLSKTQIGVILKNVALLQKENAEGFSLTQRLLQAVPELKDFILELLVKELPQGLKPKVEIPNLLKRIEEFYLQKRYKELQQQLSSYGPGQVPLELLKEQIEIQKKLKSK